MAMSDAVYATPWSTPARDGASCSIQVTNTLPTVAAKSSALVRHERGDRDGSRRESGNTASPKSRPPPPGAGGDPSRSGEGVTEGGGEPLESGGELGINDSHIGLQPKLSARKRFVFTDLDRLRVETGDPQVPPQRARVQRVRFDRDAPCTSRFGDRGAGEIGNERWGELERGPQQPLREHDADRDDSLAVPLQPLAFRLTKREPPGRDLRFGLLLGFARTPRGLAPRVVACADRDGLGPRSRFFYDAIGREPGLDLLARNAPPLRWARAHGRGRCFRRRGARGADNARARGHRRRISSSATATGATARAIAWARTSRDEERSPRSSSGARSVAPSPMALSDSSSGSPRTRLTARKASCQGCALICPPLW